MNKSMTGNKIRQVGAGVGTFLPAIDVIQIRLLLLLTLLNNIGTGLFHERFGLALLFPRVHGHHLCFLVHERRLDLGHVRIRLDHFSKVVIGTQVRRAALLQVLQRLFDAGTRVLIAGERRHGGRESHNDHVNTRATK